MRGAASAFDASLGGEEDEGSGAETGGTCANDCGTGGSVRPRGLFGGTEGSCWSPGRLIGSTESGKKGIGVEAFCLPFAAAEAPAFFTVKDSLDCCEEEAVKGWAPGGLGAGVSPLCVSPSGVGARLACHCVTFERASCNRFGSRRDRSR